jgi:hypothetical protein
MNLANETLQFVAAGDLHSITLTMEYYSAIGTPDHLDLIIYGSSDGTTYGTALGETTVYLTKGIGQVITESSLFPVTSNMVTHGARISLTTNSGTANMINIGLITARVHKAR